MQSIEQHYYRETEEQNSNEWKLLVKKDDMLDSLDGKELRYDNSTNGINLAIRKNVDITHNVSSNPPTLQKIYVFLGLLRSVDKN
ncbi:hypothetical protein pdam_00020615 [Pocillopora damicornis]|uniref:Uncharacterized protein n=1 Tax=Pocillopora damicornis TaxID=46731 RepID=A0A3M6UI66_POCDA|nr:hypothetical protein pdam_00020615 [Pocillopora damicornis]